MAPVNPLLANLQPVFKFPLSTSGNNVFESARSLLSCSPPSSAEPRCISRRTTSLLAQSYDTFLSFLPCLGPHRTTILCLTICEFHDQREMIPTPPSFLYLYPDTALSSRIVETTSHAQTDVPARAAGEKKDGNENGTLSESNRGRAPSPSRLPGKRKYDEHSRERRVAQNSMAVARES